MAILHGSWLVQNQGGCLFIWGETWRSLETSESPCLADVPAHPLAMPPTELVEWLRAQSLQLQNLCRYLLTRNQLDARVKVELRPIPVWKTPIAPK